MSAEISIQNGVAEMFSGNGLVPWHKLGTVVSGLLTAKEAIEAAHLAWLAVPKPVTVNGIELPFPKRNSANPDDDTSEGWQGICRNDTGDCLGIVKGRYTPIQNVECFSFLDSLVADGQLRYETAGALRGGKQVWIMAKYDGEMEINSDKHEQWLLLVTSHDGSKCLECLWTTVRVVCANTLSLALRGKKNSVKIRHSANWEGKRSEAQRVLGLTQDYFGNMRDALSGMNEQPMDAKQMNDFVRLLFPAKDEKEVPTRTSNMRWGTARLFDRGAGNKGVSRWDALNAVTDFADHQTTLRGQNSTRLESSMFGSAADLKQRAFDLLTAEDFTKQLIDSRPHIIVPSSAITSDSGNEFARLLQN